MIALGVEQPAEERGGAAHLLLDVEPFEIEHRRHPVLPHPARDPRQLHFRPRRIDYKMPDINGIELTGRLRKSDRDAPVILITGYPDENISARAATAGIKDVVLKPLLDENLVKCIRHAIKDRPSA